MDSYVSLKTANDLLRPFLENYSIGNPPKSQDFVLKVDELLKYKTNNNFHYFLISNVVTQKVYRFSNISKQVYHLKKKFT